MVYLDRVQVAVTSEWKAKDMCGILVPSDLHRAWHGVFDVRKDLPNHISVGAHADPLSKLGSHMNHDALTLRKNTPTFMRGPPALQLNL